MAVYFDHRLDTDRSGINIDTQWYDGSPILAVNTYSDDTGGSVNLFLDEVYILFCLFLNFLNNHLNKKNVIFVKKTLFRICSNCIATR